MLTPADIAWRAFLAWAVVSALALIALGISLHLDRRNQRKDNDS